MIPIRGLASSVENNPPLFVEHTDPSLGLKVHVHLPARSVRVLHNNGGLAKCYVNVSHADGPVPEDVALLVNLRRIRLHRLDRVGHYWKRLIVHFNQRHCSLSRFQSLGGNNGH